MIDWGLTNYSSSPIKIRVKILKSPSPSDPDILSLLPSSRWAWPERRLQLISQSTITTTPFQADIATGLQRWDEGAWDIPNYTGSFILPTFISPVEASDTNGRMQLMTKRREERNTEGFWA